MWISTEPFCSQVILAHVFLVLRFVFEERDEAANFRAYRFSICIILFLVHSDELRTFSQILALQAVFCALATLLVFKDDFARVKCVFIMCACVGRGAVDSIWSTSAGINTFHVELPDIHSFVASEMSFATAGDVVRPPESVRSHVDLYTGFVGVVASVVRLAVVPDCVVCVGPASAITCDPV